MANTLFTQSQNGQNGAFNGSQYNNAMKYCNERGITPKQAVMQICEQRGIPIQQLMGMFNR